MHASNLIGGKWTTAPAAGTYRGYNATDDQPLEGDFQISTPDLIASAVQAAVDAQPELDRLPAGDLSEFLSSVAIEVESRKGLLFERCSQETGLDIDGRLVVELARTVNTIRSFADSVRKGEVANVHLVSALPDRKPRSRPDLRTRRKGIGPVAVLEASNFPMAFGVLGGDTISALAARCPVVVKVHPGHPGTSAIFADCLVAAAKKIGLKTVPFSLLHGDIEVVENLVRNESLRGVGFTGSRRGGFAIRKLAEGRKRPLDALSLEMGSINPLFLFPGAVSARYLAIAEGLTGAVFVGSGQFCTKPQNVFYVRNEHAALLVDDMAARFRSAAPFQLLGERFRTGYEDGSRRLEAIDGVTKLAEGAAGEFKVPGRLFRTGFETFVREPLLHEEVFGPDVILIECKSVGEFIAAARLYEGELTGTIHIEPSDGPAAAPVVDELELRVGRLIANGYPPGVEVCDAMNHGGPWPSAYGNVTVVGPSSIERWLRVICYQDLPAGLLPSEVANEAASGFRRFIDGTPR